ncbi:unnamed protein product [Rhizophagus irregularis]|uniref:Uncharacterized protein n=1 Tax=Rhizophagus irregularis TaxID=588596 RepID=A0A2I1H2E0_9GLOM|nr:hypothetical protein RhiirA4_471040 [Rhizophagus irregularis]CAB4436259.1 unnamed protein product [Rhizophagus irregularis]
MIDISDYNIYVVTNNDVIMTSLIVYSLKKKRANNVCLLVPTIPNEFQNLGVPVIRGKWSDVEDFLHILTSDTIVVISMLYHDFEIQYNLFQACIYKQISLFITFDSGMELEHHVRNKSCPRTRLHQMLIDYDFERFQQQSPPTQLTTNWILFQVGIFDIETIQFDISTVTSTFNSPNQFIFLNVTVKDDLASLIVESITNPNLQTNRNYVVGEFIAHTFLGHIYQVFNKGVQLNTNLPADISEFDTSNQLRLSGIISARPLPQIIFPNYNLHINKLAMELSLQYGANIYKILSDHKRISLKQWVYNRISNQQSSS